MTDDSTNVTPLSQDPTIGIRSADTTNCDKDKVWRESILSPRKSLETIGITTFKRRIKSHFLTFSSILL